ncbi:MAG: hypothetical protein KIG53_05050 [Oscillospiraceae bacterium]|nr:hypothetical protein [Oscillospiraceae bacterium]
MNNKNLIALLLLLLFVKGYTQNLKLADLTRLNNVGLVDFQEYMYKNKFLFYHADTDERTKTDTVLFINNKNLIAGFITSKKENTVFLENIEEGYFSEWNDELKSHDFNLVDTKIKTKNILEKTYINTTTEIVVRVSVISDIRQSNRIKNIYKITIFKPHKRIFKKYLSQT